MAHKIRIILEFEPDLRDFQKGLTITEIAQEQADCWDSDEQVRWEVFEAETGEVIARGTSRAI